MIPMPAIDTIVTVCFFLVSFPLLMLLLVLALRRLLEWMEDRGWIVYVNDSPTYGTLGNAFLALQSIVEPEKHYVLEARQQEEMKEDDGEAGSDKAGA
jgi:hypothetical protein